MLTHFVVINSQMPDEIDDLIWNTEVERDAEYGELLWEWVEACEALGSGATPEQRKMICEEYDTMIPAPVSEIVGDRLDITAYFN